MRSNLNDRTKDDVNAGYEIEGGGFFRTLNHSFTVGFSRDK